MAKKKGSGRKIKGAIKGTNARVGYRKDKEKYSKKVFIQVYKGYDFLENLLVVRSFIHRKHGVDIGMLELLLKLMAMKAFTRAQYRLLPKQFTYTRLKYLMDAGYVNMVSDHTNTEKRIFALNTKGRNIVILSLIHI